MSAPDSIFGGRVILHQPARGRGYRVNADALILADFARRHRGEVFDLGAGVGSIAIVMIARGFAARAVLVDSDGDACDLARKNVDANGFDARVEHGDVLDVARRHKGRAAVVVCNPPYFEEGAARPRSSAPRARIGNLDRFVRAAREVLGRRGRAHFVYPANNFAALLSAFRASGLEAKRARFVHAAASAPARVVLVEARASKPGGLVVEAPLVERTSARHADYTDEMKIILGITRGDDRA